MNIHIHCFLFLGITYTFMADKGFSARVHNHTHIHTPPDSLILSCGSSSNEHDDNGRIWAPDSKFLTSSENSVVAMADFQDSSLPSKIPYMTARFFTQESSYSFPISRNSRHWIRLHFYPSSYSDFNSSDGFFAVSANGIRLLRNFSAAITAQALTQSYIVREFSLQPVPSGKINLTFSPSVSMDSAYAFVNGIEIISTPEIFAPAALVGFSDHSLEFGSNTMQTMIRLNVGGQFIAAKNDSGLTRTWYDDTPYVYGGALGVVSEIDRGVKIRYPPDFPEYIAPDNVYETARSMGRDARVNANYNLTWMFQVDANFTYLVRLHFCDYRMSKVNQRVFAIFINNVSVYGDADVIAWTHAQGVPVFKDFTMFVKNESGEGDARLLVTLRPNLTTKPEIYDAILNGLEVFKVNDTEGNLAGPNPVPSKFTSATDHVKKKPPELKTNLIVIILSAVFGGFFGFAIAVGLIAFIIHRRKKMANAGRGGPPSSVATSWLPVYTPSRSTDMGNVSRLSSKSAATSSNPRLKIGGNLCRHFSLSEILQGTKSFDDSLVIGVGGFGKVYKGFIDGGTEVAIKRANPSSDQGFHEFQTEIALLSKLRHRHLVSLIGACEEGNEMILVYDYMANGTLREHLYKHENPPLTWKNRLDICIGAARGLHYLHTGAKNTIIHRDVKSTNILLDEKWVAKVSDFGLSKTGMAVDQTHVSTRVKGSFGYLDPEYFRRQQLTEKSDVYSFGVVLFEVLSGRPALNPNLPKEQVSLADWAVECYSKGTLANLIDPFIKDEITVESLEHFAETGVKCLSEEGILRPSMGTVLWNLEYAKQLQHNPDTPQQVAEKGANDAFAAHETLLSIEEEQVQEDGKNKEEEDSSSNIIFSQIMNPQGR